MRRAFFKIWRFLLPFVFVFVLMHFLKDLTQDIFKIATPIDYLGDIKEDFSKFSPVMKGVYLYGFGGISFIAEMFLLIAIPKVLWRNEFSKSEKLILLSVIYLAIYFAVAFSLSVSMK